MNDPANDPQTRYLATATVHARDLLEALRDAASRPETPVATRAAVVVELDRLTKKLIRLIDTLEN
jgi:hypothetical protein